MRSEERERVSEWKRTKRREKEVSEMEKTKARERGERDGKNKSERKK